MRKPSRKTLKAKADRLAGAWFRKSGCARGEGCAGRTEWAHLKSRGRLCIRHSPFNALPLCWKCHKFFTENPDEFYKFVEERFPGRWDFLNARIQEAMDSHEKPDYEHWIEFYSQRTDTWEDWID